MENIRDRFAALLWDEEGFLNKGGNTDPKAEEYYNTLTNGDVEGTLCWSDLDYTIKERAYCPCNQHYKRILRMLHSFGKQRLREDKEYIEKLNQAIRFWLTHDFTNPNWWHNEIGRPMNFGNIALMMSGYLEKDVFDGIINLMLDGSMAAKHDRISEWTGANLLWGATNTIRHALLIGDEKLLQIAVRRAEEELVIGLEEGLQYDAVFFQHGPRVYSGGYGLSYAKDLATISYLLQGSEYQFKAEKLDILLFHMLDGVRFMMHRGFLDYSCMGRNISRVGRMRAGIEETLWLLTNNSDIRRQDELREFYASVNGGRELDRTKYFPTVNYLCHHFDGMYVGSKFQNNQTRGAEKCNGEGNLCYNMTYGTNTCIMRTGLEYYDVNPVWDYSKVPGTTARFETDREISAHKDMWGKTLQSEHAGGEQAGDRAVVFELQKHDSISVLAADFAIPHGVVRLGADIKSTRPETLFTTVDQCNFVDGVKQENGAIIHNGIRYTSLDGTFIKSDVKTQHGSWHRNSSSMQDIPVQKQVLTLTVTHNAGDKGKYAYMVSSESVDEPEITVLRNDAGVQAILLPDGKVMAVFHEDCELTFFNRVINGKKGIYIE